MILACELGLEGGGIPRGTQQKDTRLGWIQMQSPYQSSFLVQIPHLAICYDLVNGA